MTKIKECLKRALEKAARPPKFPQKLPGALWGITTYFNSSRDPARRRNYEIFRQRNKAQGLKLLAIELALPGQVFELNPNDADKVVQVQGGDMMWQKERLLNLGLKHLPDDCDKVVWLDADIVFLNDQWIAQTSQQLEAFVAVQPFQKILWASPELTEYLANDNRTMAVSSNATLRVFNGTAKAMRAGFLGFLQRRIFGFGGCPGFGFAMRREPLDKIGFYDRAILGGGDSIMASAFLGFLKQGVLRLYKQTDHYTPEQTQDFSFWAKQAFACVQKSVCSVSGEIIHLWHGSLRSRQYMQRKKILKELGFDPRQDIRIDACGAWAWSSDKQRLREAVQKYFEARTRAAQSKNLYGDYEQISPL